jgi:hypothetical protein
MGPPPGEPLHETTSWGPRSSTRFLGLIPWNSRHGTPSGTPQADHLQGTALKGTPAVTRKLDPLQGTTFISDPLERNPSRGPTPWDHVQWTPSREHSSGNAQGTTSTGPAPGELIYGAITIPKRKPSPGDPLHCIPSKRPPSGHRLQGTTSSRTTPEEPIHGIPPRTSYLGPPPRKQL